MKRIINSIKKIFSYQKKISVLEMIMREYPEAVGPTGIIDLHKACEIRDKQRIRIIEQMLAAKFVDMGNIRFKQLLDYECNPHSPEFYEDSVDYDFYIRGFCAIGGKIYIFDESCKSYLLTSMRKSWIEKFMKYVSNEDNLIFETEDNLVIKIV